MNLEQINSLIEEAMKVGNEKSLEYFDNELNGKDKMPCGFAWIVFETYQGKKINGRTKIGKMLKELGLKQVYEDKKFYIWNPGGLNIQNIDCKEVGARAVTKYINDNSEFYCWVNSRLD